MFQNESVEGVSVKPQWLIENCFSYRNVRNIQ